MSTNSLILSDHRRTAFPRLRPTWQITPVSYHHTAVMP